MTIEQCYQMIGGSYEETLGRIPGREMLCKFLGAFLQDPSFSQLCAAMDSGDPEAAFLAAHTLKGVCGNLGLGGLQRSAGELTEVLLRIKTAPSCRPTQKLPAPFVHNRPFAGNAMVTIPNRESKHLQKGDRNDVL